MDNNFAGGLVSIIMPMYNSADYVGEAVTSVIHQTYTNWELLVVDDGSNDGSNEIIEDFVKKDPRIRLLHNDRHINMPSAPRNFGLLHAKGRFIAFLDSDDCWLPGKLEEQLPLFDDAQVAVVYSNYEKTGRVTERSSRVVKAPPTTDYKHLLFGNIIGNLTGIYDRSKVGTVIILDVHHEDYAMWLEILKKGFIAKNTNSVTALYRVADESVSSNKLKLLSWQWNIYRQVEHLSWSKSVWCYLHYAYNAYRKQRI